MNQTNYLLIALMSLLLMVSVSSESHASEKLRLTGQVTEIVVVEEDTKTVRLKMGFDLTVQNISDENVIIYKSDFALLSLNLFTLDKSGKELHLFSVGGRASNYESSEAILLQKELDKDLPPYDFTYLLGARESSSFKIETECVFLKSKISASANLSWDEISKAAPILIRLKLEVFPSYLKKQYESESFSAFELKNRWKTVGYLLLDDIVSEPVPLNLNDAVVKTASQN